MKPNVLWLLVVEKAEIFLAQITDVAPLLVRHAGGQQDHPHLVLLGEVKRPEPFDRCIVDVARDGRDLGDAQGVVVAPGDRDHPGHQTGQDEARSCGQDRR